MLKLTTKGKMRAVASLTASSLAIIAIPSPAQAGVLTLNTPISGSTYSSSTTYYLSSEFRKVTLDRNGNVYVNLDSAPKLSNGSADYMKWIIYITPNDSPVKVINQDPSAWTDMGYFGPPGTYFRNKFARGTTCNNCNHNFSGNMDY
ncbi:hypothetical protein [Micromonospora sp. HUAS LYJ1]|uniref:hypothetical protein n=1 Tax=Micromonospora sp. HUAS LYJ1 TaxID=3061626 RepID=UPI0026720076|nr:hypothetical protein [Micromonospora sp. HUAS LYJ1]WKU07263.1 hypothetical protein Q2K16_09555 [Micromonospora sp. HUAS LYJ1]